MSSTVRHFKCVVVLQDQCKYGALPETGNSYLSLWREGGGVLKLYLDILGLLGAFSQHLHCF